MSDQMQAEDGILHYLRPRTIWRRFILYNRFGMGVLAVYNRIRWPRIVIPVILWPPARGHFDEIENDIRFRHHVLRSKDYRVSGEDFPEFVQAVYAIDKASVRKINIKLTELVRPPLEIRVLDVRFRWPRLEVQDILNHVRCKDVHVLKDQVRADYRDRIDNYIFDVILHSTETQEQGVELHGLLRRYAKPIGP